MNLPHVHGTHTRAGIGPFRSCQGADLDRTHSFKIRNRNKDSICLYRKSL
jgi:hypothetical protein